MIIYIYIYIDNDIEIISQQNEIISLKQQLASQQLNQSLLQSNPNNLSNPISPTHSPSKNPTERKVDDTEGSESKEEVIEGLTVKIQEYTMRVSELERELEEEREKCHVLTQVCL